MIGILLAPYIASQGAQQCYRPRQHRHTSHAPTKNGTKHYKASFSEENDILDILRLFHDDGMKLKAIADLKGRNIVTIHDIIYRKHRKHVAPGLYPAPTTDGRSHRKFKHGLSDEQVTHLCLQHHAEGINFHRLSQAYGIDWLMAERIYNRWLREQGFPDPKPPVAITPISKQWATSNRQRAKKFGITISDFTEPQWHVIEHAYGYRCVYCLPECAACISTSHELVPDHIISFPLGGPNTAANVVPACRFCNSKKSNGPPPYPMDSILAQHPFRATVPALPLQEA